MNENKTAITELIEWMENVVAQEPLSNNHISHGKIAMYNLIIDKARALESSQAKKDKGLVEELNEVLHTPCLFTDSWRVVERAKEILSRHEKGAK